MLKKRLKCFIPVLAALTFGVSLTAHADANYPNKAIQIILPIAPGGDTDVNARVFNRYLEKELGKPLVAVNIDGGGGTIGMRRVMSSKPDGYTALFFHGEAMVPKLAGLSDIDLESFQMVAVAMEDDTTILVTGKDAPYKDLKSFVEYAKAHPGETRFGMLTGGYPHLVGVALEEELGVKMNLIDVGGNTAKIVALRGGRIDLMNVQYNLVRDYLKAGNFVNLGLLSSERNPLIEDVPTASEQGYPTTFNKFFFFAMPKDTPADVVATFSEAVRQVVENQEYQAEAKKLLVTPTYLGPEEGAEFARAQYQTLAQYQGLLRGQ
jgi:tripartite-type tricarboxylate transporter receptor subunit TctC